MYLQFWCPVELRIVAGDANGVWWQFHEDCNEDIEHDLIDPEHAFEMEVWPLDEEFVYYRGLCACTYRTRKHAVERAAELAWRDHYLRAKVLVTKGVDSVVDK